MNNDEQEYVPEYSLGKTTTNYANINKIKNTLDHMKFQDEEYKKFKLVQRIKEQIISLGLMEKYINEIIDMCYYYYKVNKNIKGDDKVRIADIISIVTYKIIKKYHIRLSHAEIFQKLNLDKGKY